MDTTLKNLNNEEKENVLMVLNEFTEEYKANVKSTNALVSSVNELSQKITLLLERSENPELKNEASAKLEDLVKDHTDNLRVALQDVLIPENEIRELSQNLQKNILLLNHPVPQKIMHHHHVPKLTWIAAGLLVGLALVAAGWYMTNEKLDGYISSDTKYRYLKLDTGNIYLQKLLYHTDSVCRKNVSMREIVINTEEQYRSDFELLQKANQMNAEAENLKAGAKKLKEKAGGK